MRIAVPIWEGRVSPVFDTATRLVIIEVQGNKELKRFEADISTEELHKKCDLINELKIDCLICGAISRIFLERLNALDIKVIYGISGKVDMVVNAYLNNKHFKFTMPGYHFQKGGNKKDGKRKDTKGCKRDAG